jgi:hypothetical protein
VLIGLGASRLGSALGSAPDCSTTGSVIDCSALGSALECSAAGSLLSDMGGSGVLVGAIGGHSRSLGSYGGMMFVDGVLDSRLSDGGVRGSAISSNSSTLDDISIGRLLDYGGVIGDGLLDSLPGAGGVLCGAVSGSSSSSSLGSSLGRSLDYGGGINSGLLDSPLGDGRVLVGGTFSSNGRSYVLGTAPDGSTIGSASTNATRFTSSSLESGHTRRDREFCVFYVLSYHRREVSASHARLFGACGCVSGREGPETNERTYHRRAQ